MRRMLFSLLLAMTAGSNGAENQPPPQKESPSRTHSPPSRMFRPVELLKRRELNFTGSFHWDKSGTADPLVVLDYMEVDGQWWIVERDGPFYYTVTNRERLNQIVETERRRACSNYRLVPYTGMWSWKDGTKLTPKPFLGERLSVLATNMGGTWFVLDNRPTRQSVMGAMTPVTNDFQFLLIMDETFKSLVRQRNGELPGGPLPGLKDPPAKKENDPPGF